MNVIDIETKIGDTTVKIRPINAGDASKEIEFVRRLSPESKRFRFLGTVKELSPDTIKKFCNVDGIDAMAFIATTQEHGEEIEIGVSRYAATENPDIKEIAITIADEWQHKGLGTLLTQHLINYAKTHGVKSLCAIELHGNVHMRQLSEQLGMTAKPDPDDASQMIYSLSL